MKFTPRLLAALVAAPLILAAGGCVVAPASPPPAPAAHPHPAYLRALSDLRDARWHIERRGGDAAVGTQEDVAIVEIDRAINEARTAAMEDGKNVAQHPREDATIGRAARLHHADDLLHKARRDVAEGESNPNTVDLRNRVIGHIDLAIQATERAIHDVEAGR